MTLVTYRFLSKWPFFLNHFCKCLLTDLFTGSANFNNVSFQDSLIISHIDTNEVLNAITKLKRNLSVGINMIPNFIVESSGNLFAPALCHIFTLSLKFGVFDHHGNGQLSSQCTKTATLAKVNNYRPISLLCTFSKVFEILIRSRVFYYFRHKCSSVQPGF